MRGSRIRLDVKDELLEGLTVHECMCKQLNRLVSLHVELVLKPVFVSVHVFVCVHVLVCKVNTCNRSGDGGLGTGVLR